MLDLDSALSRCQDWGNDDAEELAREAIEEIEALRSAVFDLYLCISLELDPEPQEVSAYLCDVSAMAAAEHAVKLHADRIAT